MEAYKLSDFVLQNAAEESGDIDIVRQTFKRLTRMFKGGKLRVYRMITAPADWTPANETGDFGIYWTWDWQTAYAHFGDYEDDHVKWLLETYITFPMIDWVSTLKANVSSHFSDEHEITLKEDTEVKLTKYELAR